MEKVLKVISWSLFFISGIAGIVAFVCTIAGIVSFMLVPFSNVFAEVFAYFALGYFISVIFILLACAVFYAYKAIKKAVKKP
jgi:hypothetical protein